MVGAAFGEKVVEYKYDDDNAVDGVLVQEYTDGQNYATAATNVDYHPRYNTAPGDSLEIITNAASTEINRFH